MNLIEEKFLMKKEYLFYERVRPFLVSHPYYLSLLRWVNRLVTLLMPLLYFYVLWAAYLKASEIWVVLAYLLVPASGFILLSVIRKAINWPRPYELGTLPSFIRQRRQGEFYAKSACLFGGNHFDSSLGSESSSIEPRSLLGSAIGRRSCSGGTPFCP